MKRVDGDTPPTGEEGPTVGRTSDAGEGARPIIAVPSSPDDALPPNPGRRTLEDKVTGQHNPGRRRLHQIQFCSCSRAHAARIWAGFMSFALRGDHV